MPPPPSKQQAKPANPVNPGTHLSVINDIMMREFQLMRQWQEQKHLRMEKVLQANTKQVTAAVVQAMQSQLRSTQQQMVASAAGGFKAPGQVVGEPTSLAVAAPQGTAQKFFPQRDDEDIFQLDTVEEYGDDDLEDEDEDVARHKAEFRSRLSTTRKQKAFTEVSSAYATKAGQHKARRGDAWAPEPDDEEFAKKETAQKGGKVLARTEQSMMGNQVGKMKQIREQRDKTMEWQNEETMPPGRKFARKTVFHPRFEWVVSGILLLCAITVGIETSFAMANLDQEQPAVFRVLDIFFNLCFTTELAFRLVADYLYFVSIYNPSLPWNILDIVLVLSAILQEIVDQIQPDEASGVDLDTSGLRVVRLVRLVRIVRIVRLVRFFSDLRVMVNGIKMSARALVWAMLLLMLVIYMYGVTFMQLARNYIELDKPDHSDLQKFYGSMGATIGTLFMTISGGILWYDAVKPLAPIGFYMEPLFGSFVVFTIFCCLNIVAGIFVDNAQNSKKSDESIVRREYAKERRRYMQDVAELFHKIDICSNGEVTKAEFSKRVNKEAVLTLFRKLGVPLDGYDSEELWDLFDLDQQGFISEDEFALAIRQFQGTARSLDMAQLRKDTGEIRKQLELLVRAIY